MLVTSALLHELQLVLFMVQSSAIYVCSVAVPGAVFIHMLWQAPCLHTYVTGYALGMHWYALGGASKLYRDVVFRLSMLG